MVETLIDKEGKDVVLTKLKSILSRSESSLGSFELAVNPNVLTSITAEKIGKAYDNTTADLYSNIVGYIYSQDAVPWHRADATLTGKRASLGFEVTADTDITDEMAVQFYDYMSQVAPGMEFTLINGKMRFINFRVESFSRNNL